jgi:stage V sporulation protein G
VGVEITEVRIKLLDGRDEKLHAFCSVTFDNQFVVRDLKIISGAKGTFIAMPSRKLSDRCPRCSTKNHLRAKYCNECGNRLATNRAGIDERGRARLHADIAHPINQQCRQMVQERVIREFQDEFRRAQEPGYQPRRYDDFEPFTDDEFPEKGFEAY